MYEFKKECCTVLASLDPRLIVAEPDTMVKIFKQVLTKLVDTKMENS